MLLIVGLDGATWEVADPLIGNRSGAQPRLPARAWNVGTAGFDRSTGDFSELDHFLHGREPGPARDFRLHARAVRHLRGGVPELHLPFRADCVAAPERERAARLGPRLARNFPPEPINGCVVSGFDTPVTTRADASFVYPPEMAAVVMETGGFPFADFQEFRIGSRWYSMALQRMRRSIETKTRLARKLIGRERWDCFVILFGESDTVAHHFWKFHDSHSPRFEDAPAELRGAVAEVYQRLDDSIGQLLS